MKLPKNFKTIIDPYSFQLEGIVFGVIHNQAGLLYDMGLGKTMIAINISRYRIQQNNINKILVIAPTTIMLNWQSEIYKFSEYDSLILHGGSHQDKIDKIRFFKNSPHHFGIINYESIPIFYKDISDLYVDSLIFDESARYIRSVTAKRTQAAIALADNVKYKLILTATPIANRPIDIWSQFRVLDWGNTFGSNFYSFREKFFNKLKLPVASRRRGRKVFFYNKYILKKEYSDYINEKIFELCIRKTKDECGLDLPEQIFQKIDIPLDDRLNSIYSKIEKEVKADIETAEGDKQVNIPFIFTKLIRLQQVTSGFIGSSGEEYALDHRPKLDTLIEYILNAWDAEESIIVLCRFKKSISMIEEKLNRLKIKNLTFSGEDKGKKKHLKWTQFQKDKSIAVFIAQIASGGIGIELFKEDSDSEYQHMCFYENSFILDERIQATGRIHRIGQKSNCLYTDFIVKDTIDEKIYNTIKGNKEISDIIMRDGTKGFLKE